MAYFTSLWKARIIEKCRREYEDEKINAILASKTEVQSKSVIQRWRLYSRDTKTRLTAKLKKCFPDGSSLSNMYYLRTDQTFPNFVLKSIVGFLGGIVLTYLCFVFFVFQLSISLVHATIMSSIIGVLLTLGLAFSYRIRCLVLLLIPQLFSRVGRYTLTCYALVLILTGPATNTFKNSEVLSESMACSQEQIKTSVRQINEAMKKPFNGIKDSIKIMVETMRQLSFRMDAIVSKISVLIMSIADVIQSSISWLNSVANNCSKTFGSPYDYCMEAIDRGVLNCKRTFGANLSWICNASTAKSACMTVGRYKSFCFVADYATTSFAATLKRKLRIFTSRIKTMLAIDVEWQHTYTFSSNASGSASQVAAGIVTEIRNRADPLLTWLSWSSCVTSLFLLLIIFRAKYYQHMYETRSRFDNRYITQELRELDLNRYREGRETVLPLNRRELAKYISVTSFRLVSSEKLYLTRSIIFMTITTFKLLIHIVADYSLYWVLMTIRYHGRLQTSLPPGPSDAGVHISGCGIVADFIRSIFNSLTIPLLSKVPSPATCLPNPYPPDLQRYTQIAILIILLWFFALFEPYGLRLRHVIMGHYRPERAKVRAVWLYNHILRTRASFMKLARRKLHREYKYSNQEHLTFRHWIDSLFSFWILRYICGTLPKELRCLLCNTLEEPNDLDTKLISCATPNCVGVYCTRCYSEIGCLCTICLSPADYGDMSDISLEEGTSDDNSSDQDTEDERNHFIQSPKLNRNKVSDENTKNLFKESVKTKNIARKKAVKDNTNRAQDKVLLLPSSGIDDTSYKNQNNYLYKTGKNTFVINGFNITIIVLKQKQTYFQLYNNDKRHYCQDNFNNINEILKKIHRKHQTNKYCKQCIGLNEIKFKKDNLLLLLSSFSNINKRIHTNFELKSKKKFEYKTDRKERNNRWCHILRTLSKSHRVLRVKVTKNSKFVWKSSYKLNVYNITPSKQCFRTSKINRTSTKLCKYKSYKLAKEYIKTKRRILNFQSINICKKYKSNKNYYKECDNKNKLTNNLEPVNNSSNSNDILNSKNKQSSKKALKNSKRGKEIEKGRYCLHIQKLCSLCSSCFIHMRTNIISSKEVMDNLKKKGCLFSEDKANFKRRKKREGNKIEDGEKHRIAKEENVNARNYRLCTYLLDQTWLKQKFCKDSMNERIKSEIALSYLAKLRLKAANQQAKEAELLNAVNSNVNCKSKSSKHANPLKLDFERLSSSIKSITIKDIKLAVSERFLHVRIKNPLPIMRDLYSTLLDTSSQKKKGQNGEEEKVTDDKGVLALPAVQSCSCQYIGESPTLDNQNTQIHKKNTKYITQTENPMPIQDADLEDVGQICTCSSHYRKTNKDKSCSCMQWEKVTKEFGETANIDYSSELTNSSETLSTIFMSEDTKTDTTVCSRVAIDYEVSPKCVKPRKNVRKIRIDVVTKTNHGTTTDKAKLCDVSTLTSDWWSPIIERKFTNERLGRKKVYGTRKQRKLPNNDRSVSTDGRMVTFMSRAQIIPTETGDILSPSRYLLESQKYYNELFSAKFYSPRAYPVNIKSSKNNAKPCYSKESDRKGRKPKRLNKRYSPHLKISKSNIDKIRSDETSLYSNTRQ